VAAEVTLRAIIIALLPIECRRLYQRLAHRRAAEVDACLIGMLGEGVIARTGQHLHLPFIAQVEGRHVNLKAGDAAERARAAVKRWRQQNPDKWREQKRKWRKKERETK
jgi:hypothetical protein